MDPNGRIYIEDEDKIPGEDKARLDGYLRARADMDAVRAEMERIERTLETRGDGSNGFS